jgi:hypothetical protein
MLGVRTMHDGALSPLLVMTTQILSDFYLIDSNAGTPICIISILILPQAQCHDKGYRSW